MILAALSYCQSKAPALHSTTAWPSFLATASVALLCSPYGGLKYPLLDAGHLFDQFRVDSDLVAAWPQGSG